MGYAIEQFICLDAPISQFLTCPICFEILKNPICTNCLHTFCKECLTQWMISDVRCPMDNGNIQSMSPAPLILKDIIGSLIIKCNYSDNGCSKTMQLSQLEDHCQKCSFAPNKGIRTWMSQLNRLLARIPGSFQRAMTRPRRARRNPPPTPRHVVNDFQQIQALVGSDSLRIAIICLAFLFGFIFLHQWDNISFIYELALSRLRTRLDELFTAMVNQFIFALNTCFKLGLIGIVIFAFSFI